MAAIINRFPAKLPESHLHRKGNFSRLFYHFIIQPENEHGNTPIDKNQPYSANEDGVGGDDVADVLRYLVTAASLSFNPGSRSGAFGATPRRWQRFLLASGNSVYKKLDLKFPNH
jgi:hypothetical protein